MIYALIQGGVVVNVIVWDGNTSDWQPPQDVTAVQVADGQVPYIGYAYDGKTFAAPALQPLMV